MHKDVTGRGLQCHTKYSYSEQPEKIFYMDGRGDSDWTYFSFVTDVLIDLPMNAEPVRAVYDASHNGNHLMLAGDPRWRQEGGRGFLRRDGTDDGATIPLKPKLQALDCKVPMGQIKTLFPLEDFTYEFWARPRIPVDGPGACGALLNFRWNVNLNFSRFDEADKTCRLASRMTMRE